jgi:hypothetical protein
MKAQLGEEWFKQVVFHVSLMSQSAASDFNVLESWEGGEVHALRTQDRQQAVVEWFLNRPESVAAQLPC